MTRDRTLDIAVTGMSARLPGVAGIDEWWSALLDGRVLLARYDRDELLRSGVPQNVVDDPNYVPVRGHLDHVHRFDNTLFQISPRESEITDPQHRIMLEVAWAALEDAGRAPSGSDLTTGVYASATGSGYLRSILSRGPLDPGLLDDLLHGTEPDFMASRLSYRLGLTGPALAVQTACSSSLVAVHLAVQGLLNGDCDEALVVAAGIDHPQAGYLHLPGGVQSATGACRPFDAAADGVVPGSGVACVVLRRLGDALADGVDPYGVILGTAINNDGSGKAGYYAPSVQGQESVIMAALNAADVSGDSVGYLESHGTGTLVGDPIEWAAASAAYRRMGARNGQLAVGGLKANIGHLDAAAGVVALIKALLVVRTGVVPPVASFGQLNPLVDADSPLYIPTESTAWVERGPRRAGVSSFGIGGTNAHVIIEEPPEFREAERPGAESAELILLSAADAGALDRSAEQLSRFLAAAAPDVADVSFTLATARAQLSERLAVTGSNSAEVVQRLAAGGSVARGHRRPGVTPRVVFLFPGQGAQRAGMATSFLSALPGFGAHLDSCLAAFAATDADLAAQIRRALTDPGFPRASLDATQLAQPALFALEYAAARAVSDLGVEPVAVAGHSLGEITAACVAGVLDLSDAARFVSIRGRAMNDCPPGAMLALGCGEAESARLIRDSGLAVEIAAINGPDGCSVAGSQSAIEAFEAWLNDRVFSRRLRTSHAFHSALIEPARPRLAAALEEVTLHRPAVPIASNLTGRVLSAGEEFTAQMFIDQVRRRVRFGPALAEMAERYPDAIVLEVGPNRVLSALAEPLGFRTVPLAGDAADGGAEAVLLALGQLWAHGLPVSLPLPRRGRLVRLPTYPFAGPTWLAPEASPDPGASAVEPVDEVRVEPAPAAAPDPAAVVADSWAEVLGHRELDAESDFFDLGGDSLLITRLARRITKELGVRVPIRTLMTRRTLGRQTAAVTDLITTAGAESP